MRETKNTRKNCLKNFQLFQNNYNRLNTDDLPLVFPFFGYLKGGGGLGIQSEKKVPTLKLMMSILTSEPKRFLPPFPFPSFLLKPDLRNKLCEAKCD